MKFCFLFSRLSAVPPPVPSILDTWIGRLSLKLVILANVSKVLFESHLC